LEFSAYEQYAHRALGRLFNTAPEAGSFRAVQDRKRRKWTPLREKFLVVDSVSGKSTGI
jgi:hypothetical protein